MESILREQWKLSSDGGMSPQETDELPDFERQIYINFYLEEKKKEEAAYKQQSQ